MERNERAKVALMIWLTSDACYDSADSNKRQRAIEIPYTYVVVIENMVSLALLVLPFDLSSDYWRFALR